MKNKDNKKTKQYSSVFWVYLRTGGIGVAATASATLMFAVAVRCLLQCLFFGALESRTKQDAEPHSEDDVAGEKNDF